MITDLHAHYPMRVVSDLTPRSAVLQMRTVSGRPRKRDKVRALILRIASILFSHRNWWSGYRVTPELMHKGQVALAMSVLYRPGEELDLSKHYGAPPDFAYFGKLLEDLQDVVDEVEARGPAVIRLVATSGELDQAIDDEVPALVHCVEGGFHLGANEKAITENVAKLAEKGVAYVTLAHLFFRDVAANANALPFLPDWAYRLLFWQPPGIGLTNLGNAAVDAMFHNRILVDISHMRPDSIKETFERLDCLDPECEMPVIATHSGFRFGRLFKQQYMLDEETVRQIQRRNGVIGLIMAQHQLRSGVRLLPTWTFKQSFKVIKRHIDKIAEITGSYEHVALGTDFDGFIKPTMSGLENMGDMQKLESALIKEYGPATADLITSANTIRVLTQLWDGKARVTRRSQDVV
jgi:microsomal dipeptidase-like Zn-dependent dipeptidase